MANFTRPVSSSIGGVAFEVLSNDEIKAISVKRIQNSVALDSFNNPVPGGLYDPALGAWGDHMYVLVTFFFFFPFVSPFRDANVRLVDIPFKMYNLPIKFLVLRRPPRTH
jgi:hypothetical protein